MANRVTATEVKEIIDVDASILDAEIDVFIKSANILTNKVNTDGGLTDTGHLKEIERWLSAHLVAIRDMRVSNEKAGEVAQGFQYKLGLNFSVTMYGQQALIIDTTGTLASMQRDALKGKIKASLYTLGTKEDQYSTDQAPEQNW